MRNDTTKDKLYVRGFPLGWIYTYYVLIVGYTHALNEVLTVILSVISIVFVLFQIYEKWQANKESIKKLFKKKDDHE